MPWLPLAILLIVALTAAALALIIFPPAEAPNSIPEAAPDEPAASDDPDEPDEETEAEPEVFAAPLTPSAPELPSPPGESGTSPAPNRPPLP